MGLFHQAASVEIPAGLPDLLFDRRKWYSTLQEMEVYLLRHAIAVPRGSKGYLEAADSKRPLTPAGSAKMMAAAKGMVRLGMAFDEILTSPLPRASATAQIVADALKREDRLVECPELAPGMPLQESIDLLKLRKRSSNLLLVGHEPGLSQLAMSLLTGADQGYLVFKKGGLARIDLEFSHGNPRGHLIWMLTPRILRALGKSPK